MSRINESAVKRDLRDCPQAGDVLAHYGATIKRMAQDVTRGPVTARLRLVAFAEELENCRPGKS